jgi:hypothetical protein
MHRPVFFLLYFTQFAGVNGDRPRAAGQTFLGTDGDLHNSRKIP